MIHAGVSSSIIKREQDFNFTCSSLKVPNGEPTAKVKDPVKSEAREECDHSDF